MGLNSDKTSKVFFVLIYGFIKGRSTLLHLLHMMDKWTECLEYGRLIDKFYSDFEKAFDNVPHKRSISKLQAYGLNECY